MALILPYTFAGAGLRTPTAWLDADFQAVADYLNTYGATLGTIGARPKPTAVGAIYVAVDQGHLWYIADGTAWHPVGRMARGAVDLVPDTDVVRLWDATPGDGAARVLSAIALSGLPDAAPSTAQLFVRDVQGVPGQTAWHQRTEDGWLAPLDRTLFRVVGAPAVLLDNTAAEVSLGLWTVEQGTLMLGGRTGQEPRSLELALALDVMNNTGTAGRTVTLRVKYGGQTGISTVLTLQTAAARKEGGLTYRLDPTGAATQVAACVRAQWDTNPTSTVHTLTPLTVNAAVNQPLEVTAQASLANTNLEVRLFSALVGLE